MVQHFSETRRIEVTKSPLEVLNCFYWLVNVRGREEIEIIVRTNRGGPWKKRRL